MYNHQYKCIYSICIINFVCYFIFTIFYMNRNEYIHLPRKSVGMKWAQLLTGSGPLTTALCCFQEITVFRQERCLAMKNMDFLIKLMLWAVQFVDIGSDQVREAEAGPGVWEKQNLQVQGEKPAGQSAGFVPRDSIIWFTLCVVQCRPVPTRHGQFWPSSVIKWGAYFWALCSALFQITGEELSTWGTGL